VYAGEKIAKRGTELSGTHQLLPLAVNNDLFIKFIKYHKENYRKYIMQKRTKYALMSCPYNAEKS
jgi:hypothetical protein